MNRNVPEAVKRQLRSEIGFGCPIPNCGIPYLTWHHFDPPWHEREHYEPRGMIALCPQHHRAADAGACTKEQLSEYKRDAIKNWQIVSGKFEWLRNKLLAVIGGNYYYEAEVIFQYQGKPIIWFTRNSNNYLLLNLRVLTTSNENRLYISQNEWFSSGFESDIDCSPCGKKLKINYGNGDLLDMNFYELISLENAQSKYPKAQAANWRISYPITAVEIICKVANSDIEFGPKETKIGDIRIRNSFASFSKVCLNKDE